jgi:putative addiction module CopG family antidote
MDAVDETDDLCDPYPHGPGVAASFPDVMSPMEIDLPPELECFVEAKVQSGEYHSADEVICHALQMVAREDQEHAAWLEALRAQLDPAIAEYERGELIPGPLAVEQAKAELRRLTALRAESQFGIDDLDNGRHSSRDEVFAKLRAERRRDQAG